MVPYAGVVKSTHSGFKKAWYLKKQCWMRLGRLFSLSSFVNWEKIIIPLSCDLSSLRLTWFENLLSIEHSIPEDLQVVFWKNCNFKNWTLKRNSKSLKAKQTKIKTDCLRGKFPTLPVSSQHKLHSKKQRHYTFQGCAKFLSPILSPVSLNAMRLILVLLHFVDEETEAKAS